MADTKITALAAITTVTPANDLLPIVDVDDHSMAASGTTKNITVNQILGAGGTATLASATITGALTVDTTTLVVNPAGYPDRVGIGTASPSGTIHSAGAAATATPTGGAATGAGLIVSNTTPTYGMVFGVGGGGSGWIQQQRVDGTNTQYDLLLQPIGGRVAIGASTANYPLDVQNNSGTSTRVAIANTANAAFGAGIYLRTLNAGSLVSNASIFTDNAGNLQIYNGTSTESLKATLDASGNLDLSAGNLKVSNGKGIDFSATPSGSGTMTSELLNDYEEGTFTPTIIGLTNDGTGTYTSQVGRYTKIGNLVTVQIYFYWTNHTGTGDMAISGLPFNLANISGLYGSPSFGLVDGVSLTAGKYLGGYGNLNSDRIIILQYPTGGGTVDGVPVDTAGEMSCSMTYRAA